VWTWATFGDLRADARTARAARDVVALPSVEGEGLPRALLEGGMLGLPGVGTRLSGVPEIIREGETGWLNRSLTSEELARVTAAGGLLFCSLKAEGLLARPGAGREDEDVCVRPLGWWHKRLAEAGHGGNPNDYRRIQPRGALRQPAKRSFHDR